MKTEPQKPQEKEAVAFDPVLFAATVPSRKPTTKDLADCKERPDDAIEPKDYPSLEKSVEDL